MWDEQFEGLLRPHLPYLPAQAPLDGDADLRHLGLDSMSMVELLATMERHYQVRFVDDALTMDTFATPASLWQRLSTVVAGR
ncbi:acyl carrier protein [Catellatospora tritici]|uniref:acyl carrier protein n=1 Tax=Catellatospora tritici TaxID=2851566 RepID=UPI001C2D398B|nr:acyl carrier protein [Catellatospora tritici]MBV1855116.1 acyl carrier protein [Catellatospora tritici]